MPLQLNLRSFITCLKNGLFIILGFFLLFLPSLHWFASEKQSLLYINSYSKNYFLVSSRFLHTFLMTSNQRQSVLVIKQWMFIIIAITLLLLYCTLLLLNCKLELCDAFLQFPVICKCLGGLFTYNTELMEFSCILQWFSLCRFVLKEQRHSFLITLVICSASSWSQF